MICNKLQTILYYERKRFFRAKSGLVERLSFALLIRPKFPTKVLDSLQAECLTRSTFQLLENRRLNKRCGLGDAKSLRTQRGHETTDTGDGYQVAVPIGERLLDLQLKDSIF